MRSKRGISVLAACGLVLGLMAVSASGAQAGMWMVNKANVSSALSVSLAAAIEKSVVSVLSTSGGNSVTILCAQFSVPTATITLEEWTFSGQLSNCSTDINGKAEPACNPLNQPVAVKGTAKAVLHEKKPYAEVVGPGGVIIDFKFDCVALPELVAVTGTGWIEDCNEQFEVELVTHLIQEGQIPASKLGGLFFGANKLTVDGSVNISFSDAAHKGQTFSGLAE